MRKFLMGNGETEANIMLCSIKALVLAGLLLLDVTVPRPI